MDVLGGRLVGESVADVVLRLGHRLSGDDWPSNLGNQDRAPRLFRQAERDAVVAPASQSLLDCYRK